MSLRIKSAKTTKIKRNKTMYMPLIRYQFAKFRIIPIKQGECARI